MHRLVHENEYARILDVQIPPGATSKFHEHAARLAGVIVSDARNWFEKPGEARGAINAPAAPGSPIENWAAKLPYTHRVGNVDVVPLHYVVAELVAPSRIAADALPDTPTRRLIKEGDVGRYYRITLDPGQSTEGHTHAQPGLTVHVTSGAVADEGDASGAHGGNGAGAWRWRNPNHQHVLRNDGAARVEIVEVDLR
jgi:quercetin dioxygenase-like cupin family protein